MKLSMSALETFSRCERKFYYRYVLGLDPKDVVEHMRIGSVFHVGLAAAYKRYDERSRFVEIAQEVVRDFVAPGFEKKTLVCDMIEYWWEQVGKYQEYSEIMLVEEPIPLDLGGGYLIERNTPDLVAKRMNGQPVLVDHKTVGLVSTSLAFIPMDLQLREYALGLFDKFGVNFEVNYNMVRRDLPPDFTRADGSTPYSLTKSGKKSMKSSDPDDYVRLHRQIFTPKQHHQTRAELIRLVDDVVSTHDRNHYRRSIIKNGTTACGSCPYLAACNREFDGLPLDGVTLSLQFNKKPSIFEPEKAVA